MQQHGETSAVSFSLSMKIGLTKGTSGRRGRGGDRPPCVWSVVVRGGKAALNWVLGSGREAFHLLIVIWPS